MNAQVLPSPDELEPLLTLKGATPIPLHSWDAEVLDAKGKKKKLGKTPKDTSWPKRDFKDFKPTLHMDRGGNVGVRLDHEVLVVDVDPRNGGNESFQRLCADTGLDPGKFPTVETGSGGQHLYMCVPPGGKLRLKLADYPGIDFLSGNGHYVVAPGSLHPDTGQHYRWLRNQDDIGWLGLPPAPNELLEQLTSGPAQREQYQQQADLEADAHTPEELEVMLSGLSPEDFSDHEDWFKLMAACHEATGGAGEDVFVAWSIEDPCYSDAEETIRTRWRSLGRYNSGPRCTRRTLYKKLREANRSDLLPKDPDALPDGDPMTIAAAMLEDLPPMTRSEGRWYVYDEASNVYVATKDEPIHSRFRVWLQGKRFIQASAKGERVETLVSRNALAADVTAAAVALCQGPNKRHDWIERRPGDPTADEIIVCRNGLLHVPSRSLLPKSARFFGVNSTPVDYAPDTPSPQKFQEFLGQAFPDEPDCISGLQEMFGLFLTRDTSHQKIFQLIGPPRSGKGTLTRLLQALIGEGNFTSPSAANLAGRFGLAPLIDKQVAVVTDMRMGKNVDRTYLVETLLRVSGEDSVSVERKGIENDEVRLSTRFLLVSNEMLQVRDTSNAIGARMILYVMRQSFQGREDYGLEAKLRGELPGILNWALDGLDRLRDRGHFEQPASAMPELDRMRRLTSPLKHYVDERLVVGPDCTIDKDELFKDFEEWCLDEDVNYTGSKPHFFRDLGSTGVQFTEERPRAGRNGQRLRVIRGVQLRDHNAF